jgi:ring-1,2-phenylacetyl-CoA epoxidase subunit PaaB
MKTTTPGAEASTSSARTERESVRAEEEGAQHQSVRPEPVEEGAQREWPLWEVFVRSKQGLEHKHCGSLHAADAQQALQMARDVYTRRQEGVSIWIVPSALITASGPDEKAQFFDPAADKIYRHPSFYKIPDEVGHM